MKAPSHSERSLLRTPLSPEQLRSHATSHRIDAVWERLQNSLPGVAPSQAVPTSRARSGVWLAALALTATAFAAGMVVGVRVSQPGPAQHVALSAEPAGSVAGGLPRNIAAQPQRAQPAGGVLDAKRASAARSVTRRPKRAPLAVHPAAQADSVSTVPEPLTSVDPAATLSVPQWQLFAQQGEYEMALATLDASGGFDAAADEASAEQLMLLVDVARATGFRQRAVQALRRVVGQHGSDPLAPLAAWSLGNMLENSGDREGAAQAFAAYRTLSPQGDFAQDALAREIRMAVEHGDAQLANDLVAQYDRAFPNGRRGDEIREQLASLHAIGPMPLSVDAGEPSQIESSNGQQP